MPTFLKILVQGIVMKMVREKIRQGSLHAVRVYIGLVQQARLISMAAVGVTTTASLVLIGFSFVLGSIIWLLPISRATVPYVFMGAGFLMVIVGSLSLRMFFKEEHWMEMSEAYTLMDKVMKMGDGHTPAEPRTGTKFAHYAKQAAQKMREEAQSKTYPPVRATQRMETQEA